MPAKRLSMRCHLVVSLWRRLPVLLGLLVFLAGSLAQATHVHGDWLPHGSHELAAQSDRPSEAGGEAGCPLCAAMHAAAPTVAYDYAPAVSATRVADGNVLECGRGRAWPFVLFSRPPPALMG